MPETTTAINACDVPIFVDDENGVPVNISGVTSRAQMEMLQEVEPYRVLGSRWVRRLACKKDGSLNLDIIYSTADDEGLALFRDWYFGANSKDARTVRILAPEDAPGSDDYTGEFLISKLNINIDAATAGPIPVTVELLPDGAISHATTTT